MRLTQLHLRTSITRHLPIKGVHIPDIPLHLFHAYPLICDFIHVCPQWNKVRSLLLCWRQMQPVNPSPQSIMNTTPTRQSLTTTLTDCIGFRFIHDFGTSETVSEREVELSWPPASLGMDVYIYSYRRSLESSFYQSNVVFLQSEPWELSYTYSCKWKKKEWPYSLLTKIKGANLMCFFGNLFRWKRYLSCKLWRVSTDALFLCPFSLCGFNFIH